MKALNQFAEKRFKRLNAVLKCFPVGQAKESLHQVRLEIKKIKALLQFIHFNNPDFKDHKHYIPLRAIFRASGKIRESGLRKELLEQYTQIHTPFYRSPGKEIRQFIKEIPGYIKVIKKQRKITLKEVAKIKSRTYRLYLQVKNEALIEHLSVRIGQKDLHGLRKLMKEIIYLTAIKTKKNKIDPFLVQSAELIGNWHDKKMIIPWLRTSSNKEKGTIKELQAAANADMQQLRKLISKRNTKKV
jgi:CHAD domain-containing protein